MERILYFFFLLLKMYFIIYAYVDLSNETLFREVEYYQFS